MSAHRSRLRLRVVALVVLALPVRAPAAAPGPEPERPALAVDHVPVAVRSLAEARRSYERLGFRLKPGRMHANGLHNAFAKLAGGGYLELITPERGAVDATLGEYAAFLARGEGGAFLALAADSLPRLARRLEAAGLGESCAATRAPSPRGRSRTRRSPGSS